MFEVTDAAELAADGYFVVVFDERGQGRSTYFVLVGPSNAPMAIAIQSFSIGSQKREDPRVEQKPLCTFSVRYHFTWSRP
jgi:hypothetical protein